MCACVHICVRACVRVPACVAAPASSLLPDPFHHHACTLGMQMNCADGVTAHVRTFLHGSARITISIATVAASEALPNEDKQQVCVCAHIPMCVCVWALCLFVVVYACLCVRTTALDLCMLQQMATGQLGIAGLMWPSGAACCPVQSLSAAPCARAF